MTHSYHEGDSILYDNCASCDQNARDLVRLDEPSLQGLAIFAKALRSGALSRSDLTGNEVVAVEHLRLMARIVFKSDISYEDAR